MTETVRCGMCGSTNTRRIVRKGWKANLLRLLGRVPFHCQACYKVFFAPRPEQVIVE